MIILAGPTAPTIRSKSDNRENVDKLQIAWKYNTGDDLNYTFSPLVVDNMAYFAAKNGSLVAVDATNGKELWIHPFSHTQGAPAAFARFAGITGQRGGNYWESKDRSDRRLFISASGLSPRNRCENRTDRLKPSAITEGRSENRYRSSPRGSIGEERRSSF